MRGQRSLAGFILLKRALVHFYNLYELPRCSMAFLPGPLFPVRSRCVRSSPTVIMSCLSSAHSFTISRVSPRPERNVIKSGSSRIKEPARLGGDWKGRCRANSILFYSAFSGRVDVASCRTQRFFARKSFKRPRLLRDLAASVPIRYPLSYFFAECALCPPRPTVPSNTVLPTVSARN